MPHPADDEYENNEPFSSPCSMPPLEPVGQQPAENAGIENAGITPAAANENVAPPAPPADEMPQDQARKSFERHAEDSFRVGVGASAETVEGFYAAATEAYENASEALRASAETFASGIAQLNWKLLEIGRRNAETNLDYMRNVSGARSMRDLVDAQTAYMREQYDAMTAQMRELQSLTTELAGKTTEPFKEQITRATQLPRIC